MGNGGAGWGRGWGGTGADPPMSPPQLPYLIDGPTKLTQSNAILRYIARKHNMGERWGGGCHSTKGGVPRVGG